MKTVFVLLLVILMSGCCGPSFRGVYAAPIFVPRVEVTNCEVRQGVRSCLVCPTNFAGSCLLMPVAEGQQPSYPFPSIIYGPAYPSIGFGLSVGVGRQW